MGIVRLSEATSLALHSLAYMAKKNRGSVSAKMIAKPVGASENHLQKVMQKLTKYGLVVSERGPKGGFVLGKKPEKISLLDIYQVMEGSLADAKCPLHRSVCPFGNKCMFCDSFADLTSRFRDFFKKKSLMDYVN